MQYELLYLVGESRKPDLDKIKEEVKNIVTKEGGSFLEPQLTKERKMSYAVEKEAKGIYITQRFEVPDRDEEKHSSDIIPNITKKMNLNTNTMRFIIVKADELPELKLEDKMEGKVGDKVFKKETKERPPKPKIETAPKEKPEKAKEEKEEDATDEEIDKKLDEILKI